MNKEEHQKTIARIVAKCWMDENYKKKLEDDAAAVLKSEGITVPEGVKIRVMEDTADLRTFIIPSKPDDLGNVEELEDRLAASACPVAGTLELL